MLKIKPVVVVALGLIAVGVSTGFSIVVRKIERAEAVMVGHVRGGEIVAAIAKQAARVLICRE